MSKSLRNTTASPVLISDTGVTIGSLSTYTIQPQDYPLWAASVNVDSLITDGTLVVNDGYDDLKPQVGLYHIHEESLNRSSSFLATPLVTVTSNSTLTLTASSRLFHVFTGTTAGQILKLPDATTLMVAHKYEVWNTSSKTVTVKDNASSTIFSLAAYQKTWLVLQVNTTTAGTWLIEANFLGGTGGGNGTIPFGFDGNASTGRWLESLTNVASNTTGYTIAGSKTIRALSVASSASATFTVTLFKNGVALDTISCSAQIRNSKQNLNHALVDLNYLSAQVTAGSCSRPVFVVWL